MISVVGYWLQHHCRADDPNRYTREVHENRGTGNLRIIQYLAQNATDKPVGHQHEDQYNGQPREFADVRLEPAINISCIFIHMSYCIGHL